MSIFTVFVSLAIVNIHLGTISACTDTKINTLSRRIAVAIRGAVLMGMLYIIVMTMVVMVMPMAMTMTMTVVVIVIMRLVMVSTATPPMLGAFMPLNRKLLHFRAVLVHLFR
ncbi:hypothetical protein NBRC116587_14210 [Pseudoteredinibacter isoporae]